MTQLTRGFYYHYKHDPEGEFGNYTYEVIGIGLHSEDRTKTVIYRPLYKNNFMEGSDYINRPYDMFVGNVEVEGKIIPRFKLITDPEIISKLAQIKKEVYG